MTIKKFNCEMLNDQNFFAKKFDIYYNFSTKKQHKTQVMLQEFIYNNIHTYIYILLYTRVFFPVYS